MEVVKAWCDTKCNSTEAALYSGALVVFSTAAETTTPNDWHELWHMHTNRCESDFSGNTCWFQWECLVFWTIESLQAGSSRAWWETANKFSKQCFSKLKHCHWFLWMNRIEQYVSIDNRTVHKEIEDAHPLECRELAGNQLAYLISR